jgi:hypothetical protein
VSTFSILLLIDSFLFSISSSLLSFRLTFNVCCEFDSIEPSNVTKSLITDVSSTGLLLLLLSPLISIIVEFT